MPNSGRIANGLRTFGFNKISETWMFWNPLYFTKNKNDKDTKEGN